MNREGARFSMEYRDMSRPPRRTVASMEKITAAVDETWRALMRDTGERLARDASDPKCDAETLMRRTVMIFQLIADQRKDQAEVELRRTT